MLRSLLCFALLCSAAPALGQEFPYAATVAADGLPVHAGPLADDYVTTTLPRGTAVVVVRHDPDGRAMIQAPADGISFAKLEWLKMTSGTAEGGGAATVVATGDELYCRVGSHVGEAPMIEQVPLKTGQAVAVQGTRTLPGPNGPEVWAQVPSPKGEHRWVQRRYLVPTNAQARADRNRDPFAVPTDLLNAAAPAPNGGGTLGAETTGDDPFAPPPADAMKNGMVEIAFTSPDPVIGGDQAAPLLGENAAAAAGLPVGAQVTLTDPFASLPAPMTPIGPRTSAADDRLADPTRADRFAAHGADMVAADRRRLMELDRRLDRLLDADPATWNLADLEADLRDLRDRASSNAVRRLAQARLVRIDVLKTVRGEYSEYVALTEQTDQRDARLTVEATEMLRRYALVEQPYGLGPYGPQTAEGFPIYGPAPRTATADPYGGAPSLAAPGAVDQMSYSQPAGPPRGGTQPPPGRLAAGAPAGAVAFEAVG
ncbi:MAG: hypothetical protein AAF907_03500, partial [Planctomycetota bacterium]